MRRLLICLALSAALQGTWTPPVSRAAEPPSGEPPKVPVKLVRVAEETGGALNGLGSARCRQSLELTFEVIGQISQIPVEEGELVQKGQVLARLDDKVQTAELQAKQAESLAAAAEVERQKARKEEKEKLFQGRAATAAEVREAGYELEKALAKAKATQAEVAALQGRERNMTLRAPVAGVVLKRLSEPGEVASPNSNRKVIRFGDCRQVLAEVELGERLYTQVKVGQEAQLVADALPGRRFNGKVQAVGVEVDEKNRTFVVKVALDNPDLALKPGMFVRAALLAPGQAATLWLPPQALTNEQGDQAQVTVIQDRKATVRKVRLGRREPGRVQVVEGVSAGELVLVPTPEEPGPSTDKRP